MATEKPNPTMKDVAQEAGVALGTVSKVVNGIPVGEEYRVRVEKAIKKLGYRVNIYARGLRNERTRTIQVIIPNLTNPFFAELVHHITKELAQKDYKTMLCMTDGDPSLEQTHILMAKQHMADGIICLSYDPTLQAPEHMPLVSIDRYFGAQIPCVSSDNYGGGRLAAEKLIENGCKCLAFLRSGTKLANEPNKRRDGFVSVCEERGVPYALKMIDDGTSYSEFEAFLQEHLHSGKLDFDGIFCVTDALAYWTRKTLRGMGLRVPEDVQIIGYDGVRSFGNMDLPCSTIVQPLEGMAKACVDLVLDSHPERTPSLICLPVSYAYGGTTRQENQEAGL